jgi:MFS family permease
MTESPAATLASTERDRTRRAWWVLGGCFLAFTLSASLMHAYTVFLLAFVAEFGWTRAEASIAYSVGQVVAGASSPLAGGLTDRLGSRRMVLLGGCLLALGLLLSAFAQTLWQVVVLYGVVMTLGANFVAYSDETSHRFRSKPATCSEANQPGIPMMPAGVAVWFTDGFIELGGRIARQV